MALVVHHGTEQAVRQDLRLGEDRRVHGAPVAGWVDDGLADHLRGAIVPHAPARREAWAPEPTPHLKPRFRWQPCLFRAGTALIAVVENFASYLVYLEARAPEDRFYNKFEAHALLLPGLATFVLVLAMANTVWLFTTWVLVSVVRLDVHDAFSTARLLPSGACGAVCFLLVLIGESAAVFSFTCSVCVFLHFLLWLLLGRCPRRQEKRSLEEAKADPPEGLGVDGGPGTARIALAAFVAALTLTWCLLFVFDAMVFLRSERCVTTRNRAMPVRVDGVSEWQCVRWHEPHYIKRKPNASEEIFKGFCSTSFHVFDKVSASNAWTPSAAVHRMHCPPQCQALGLGGVVLGCRVYDASSSVCAAAVQMGVLEPNQGGVVEVIGRPPPTAGNYDRCNLNTIKSVAGPVPAATPVVNPDPNSTAPAPAPPWSFYFQVPGMEELDMVTLHGWSRRDPESGSLNEPWRSYSAEVSWVVGGTPRDGEVVLGPVDHADKPGIELNFCHEADEGGASGQHECP